MTTSLLIGGGGFVGKNLVQRLIRSYCNCVVLDNGSGLGRIRPFPPEVRVVHADAKECSSLDLGPIDTVYYLAARVADISYNNAHKSEMLEANLQALSGMRSCYGMHPRIVVYFSTACVYPTESPVPTPETWGHIGSPESTNLGYGIAKRTGEKMAEILYEETGIATLIVRPFNIYGPWDLFDKGYGHFIPAILRKMLDHEPEITIWGGSQSRAFTYIDDLVDCIVRLANKCNELITVNVGTNEEISITDAANLLVKMTGYEGNLKYSSGPIGYARRAADPILLKKLIGDTIWTSLEEGLERTISWCNENDAASK